jgi:5-methylcytosine-specific restriction endonuclease McrBC GTP-binding regulatory subunit McrB
MGDKKSDFKIIEINTKERSILLEDAALEYRVEVPLKQSNLLSARLVGPYELEVRYEDGSAMVIRFLI